MRDARSSTEGCRETLGRLLEGLTPRHASTNRACFAYALQQAKCSGGARRRKGGIDSAFPVSVVGTSVGIPRRPNRSPRATYCLHPGYARKPTREVPRFMRRRLRPFSIGVVHRSGPLQARVHDGVDDLDEQRRDRLIGFEICEQPQRGWARQPSAGESIMPSSSSKRISMSG